MSRWAFAVLLGWTTVAHAEDDGLRVDRLLVRQIEAVWPVINQEENPLWPGWRADDTPVMIYLPGEQEVLVNHPNPPEGFRAYEGSALAGGMTVMYRDGATSIKWDGQNTSREVFGAQTLVLADTLSNRKMWLRGWLGDERPVEQKLAELSYESLRSDPYEQLAMIAHEAFHVFQMRHLAGKTADERLVRVYPCLSVDNNVAFALEGAALDECLRAEDAESRRAAAVRWLAIRRDRRANLPSEALDYEDRNEFIEGTAKYIEWALMARLEGSEADPALWWAQGFRGFEDLRWFRERRLESMLGNMRGEVNVNNDPYGTSPVRGRLYFSGMGIALLLDCFAPDWKQHIVASDATLTSLAESALQATDDELEAALRQVKGGDDYERLRCAKQRLADEGKRDTRKMLDEILRGTRTLLVIDYAALQVSGVGLSFTPFGIRPVDADRTIYTLVPISAQMKSDYAFEQSMPTPTFQDRGACQFQFQLAEKVVREEVVARLGLEGLGPWEVDDLALELPGVNIRAPRARITSREHTIHIQFLPVDE